MDTVALVERLIIAGIVFALLALVPFATRSLGRLTRARAQAAADGAALPLDPARPTILYFWTANCHQCRTAQAPTLQRLAQQAPIHVVPVDAAAERGLADRFGVLTVPTTVVLTPDGKVRAVNHGFASLATLRSQAA
ncbi:MAG: thioredoxin family protein [Anaerolineae bacterium]|nr:thioredoxin family protein [Anaerolineae bacterium]